MLSSRSASKFHVTTAKIKHFETLTITPTPHLLPANLDASMFNLKEDLGEGFH
jgi:hypothetical protein